MVSFREMIACFFGVGLVIPNEFTDGLITDEMFRTRSETTSGDEPTTLTNADAWGSHLTDEEERPPTTDDSVSFICPLEFSSISFLGVPRTEKKSREKTKLS